MVVSSVIQQYESTRKAVCYLAATATATATTVASGVSKDVFTTTRGDAKTSRSRIRQFGHGNIFN